MRRANSVRSQARSKALIWQQNILIACLGLFVLAFIVFLIKIPHGHSATSEPHAAVVANKRALIQEEIASASTSLRAKSTLMEDGAKRLANSLAKSQSDPAKLQSTDQVERLDRAAARNQLRTKVKPLPKLTAATDSPLVIYTFSDSQDPEHLASLRFYIRDGIRENDDSMHIIIVGPEQDLRGLPALQVENARYYKAKVKMCMWGAIGSFLESSTVDLAKFTSFIFVSSSARGPFLPSHVRNLGVTWQQMLTARLDNHTKLVGPIISCQDIVWPETVPLADRDHGRPYFAPDVFATDQIGLDLLMRKHDVFQCHTKDTPNPHQFSAVMASSAVLDQGYNLDCLMQRYQGVRWQEKETRGCNAGLKATEGDYYYDGISIHPMEVMFVEVNGMMLRKSLSMAKTAKLYDKWRQAQLALKEDVTTNMYAFDPKIFRAAKIAYMEKRGLGCFDFNFYSEHNPDLPGSVPLVDLWNHFVDSGQFEDREYRFNCLDIMARSFNCFDSDYYNRANDDLNQLRLEGRPLTPQEAWNHFLETGFFESRKYRFRDICDEDLDSPNTLGEGS